MDLAATDLSSSDQAGLTAPDLSPPPPDMSAPPDTLAANRDRLLGTYLDYLKANPAPQSNGLAGPMLADVCALWQKLDPSSQATWLTATARLQGSTLAQDGASMLSHVARVYRVTGGQGATASAPGSCGGGEFNRVMMSIDPTLQQALVAANAAKGAAGASGKPDLADVAAGAGSVWRDSHDAAGPHAPFTLSDETEHGAPRGQVQFFADPASAAALAPLGRVDLMTLVDPRAFEIDQDFDCVHNSNPSCSYTTYGALCAPMPSLTGTELYVKSYGTLDPAWKPAGCP
ncbi:MAG: Peptidyl-prolyl cis-trans isomerase [Myxococcales bacterium]|nr:Peptidyl-prolyl cis-trans isomerase [Myxococcales bacterium]